MILSLQPNRYGSSTITLKAQSGGKEIQDSFTITIGAVNDAPTNITLTNSNIFENQASGTFIGQINADDVDFNSSLSFSLVNPKGLFSLSSNGVLSSNSLFDFETNSSNYSILARAIDEHGLYVESTFSITLKNVVEDFDNDGTEDHFDSDDDNDGFSDSAEIAYGSDPRNNQSVANIAPQNLEINASSIQENQAVGSLVCSILGIDSDENSSLSYSLVSGQGSEHNHLFYIDLNQTLRSNAVFDFETNSSIMSIRIRVSDQYNAVLEKSFKISLSDLDEIAPVVSLQGEKEISLFVGQAYVEQGASWLDNYDGAGQLLPENQFDHTQPGEYQINYYYTDKAGNLSNIVTRIIKVRIPNIPIVQTLSFEKLDQVNFRFTGRVMGDGGAPILEKGILISENVDFKAPIRISVNENTDNGDFFSSTKLSYDTQYYFCAYAKNRMGENRGSIQKIITEKEVLNWIEQLQNGDNRWLNSPWFGDFAHYDHGWIYHINLGWLFAHPSKNNDIWLWSKEHSWIWTTQGVYPYLFKNSSTNWLYFLKKENGQARFYDFDTQSVR